MKEIWTNFPSFNKGRDKGKYSNIYVVNGSNVSEQFNNNYDPIPRNLKAKQKQLRREQQQDQQQQQQQIPRYSTSPEDFDKMYKPVNVSEICRQKKRYGAEKISTRIRGRLGKPSEQPKHSSTRQSFKRIEKTT